MKQVSTLALIKEYEREIRRVRREGRKSVASHRRRRMHLSLKIERA